jgi:hypothetical protein
MPPLITAVKANMDMKTVRISISCKTSWSSVKPLLAIDITGREYQVLWESKSLSGVIKGNKFQEKSGFSFLTSAA